MQRNRQPKVRYAALPRKSTFHGAEIGNRAKA
jgi:hypothetical protein